MSVLKEIRRRVRHVWGPVLAAAVIGYLGYHAVQGERGLIAWWQVTQQIERSEATLAEVRGEREALERRVGSLRPESLDPDMLDERARIMLNLARPDEVVILNADGEEGGRAPSGDVGRGSGKQWIGEIR